MVLDELYGGAEVWLIELVWDVPADWSKLPAFLHGGVEEGDAVKHGLPLRHVSDVQQLLIDQAVRTLQAGLDPLRRLGRELDGRLQEVDGELGVWLCRQPRPELGVDVLCACDLLVVMVTNGVICWLSR